MTTRLIVSTLVVGAAHVLGAQGPQLAPPAFSSLRWRYIGPTSVSGRVNDIAVARVKGQPDQIYAGFGGGIFKSTNAGISWAPVFDQVDGMLSVGALDVAPSNPNVVWVGTGEAVNPANDWGDGVYKSVDAGRTWTRMGLADSRHIGRIAIHPTNPDVVWVAAQGHMWGSNAERGVFKSSDGGKTWRKVLYVDENTGANDVRVDATNPMVLYASTYQRQRRGYGGILVGPGSGIYKSLDGGETWRKLTRGLPDVDMGRIGLEVSSADPKVILADIEVGGYVVPSSAGGSGGGFGDCPADATRTRGAARNQFDTGKGGVYRSVDGGESWEQVNAGGDTPVGQFNQIRTDPKDRNRVYRLGTGFYVSDDLGHTFQTMGAGIHYEHHAMWVDPDDPNHLILGTDGGLVISWDRGMTWDWRNNIPTSQFYEGDISTDARDPFIVCGGLQDNGSICMPSAVHDRNGIGRTDAFTVGGGDGMHFHIDPHDPTYGLSDADRAQIRRVSLVTLQAQTVKPGPGLARPVSCLEASSSAARRGPLSASQIGPDGKPYRWEWDTPILFSGVTPGVVYTAANVLFRSTDRGGSWTRISPDLTAKIDRDTIYIMGKRVGALNYSPNGTLIEDPAVTPAYGAIIQISESPLNASVLYTGANDGAVQVTRDLGKTWKNVSANFPGLPPFTPVSTVLASHHAAGRVYATFDGHLNDDDRAYVYASDDYGAHWRAITSGLPATPVNRITEHPRDPDLLVVGDRRGVHFTNDRGASWHSLATNMPTVPTMSVMFHPRDNALVAATYGRGIWILDDAGPLETLTADATKRDAVLASVTRGREWNLAARQPKGGEGELYTPNPEFNPEISYFLRDGASGSATVTITDARGNVVRTLTGPATRGLNHVAWDMHVDPADRTSPPRQVAVAQQGGAGSGGGREGGNQNTGPLVAPGDYGLAITISGIASDLRGSIRVDADPNDRISAADRAARRAAGVWAYGLQKTLVAARAAMRDASGAGTDDATLQMELMRLMGIAGSLVRGVEGFDGPPTADQRRQMQWAYEDATRAIAAVNRRRPGAAIASPPRPS